MSSEFVVGADSAADTAQLDAIATQTPEQLQGLVAKNYISEKMMNDILSARSGEDLRAQQQAALMADSAAAIKTPVGAQEAQQGADTLEAAALQGTGVNPGFQPIQQPKFADTPNLSPQPMDFTGIPSTLQKPAENLMQADAAVAMVDANAQQARANAQAAVEVSKAERAQKDYEAAVMEDKKIEDQVAQDMSSDSGWFSRIAQFALIMTGAASQALTGATKNPAIEAMEREVERQAAARKYSDEQKEKLFKQAMDVATLELAKQRQRTDNASAQANIRAKEFEIMKYVQEYELAKEQKLQAGRKFITEDEFLQIPPTADGQRFKDSLYRMPDGRYAKTVGGSAAEKVRTNVTELESALDSAKQLSESIKYFGNNPMKKVFSLAEKGKAQGLVQALVGKLRLEYFGPGVLTNYEQKIAKDMMGDPTKLLSIASANQERIDTIINKLNFARRQQLRSIGVDLPMSNNERELQKLMSIDTKYADPKYRPEAINQLIAAGKWDPNEL